MAAVGILGLAIGITTTMFTVVDALILRPVPFSEPDRLASIVMVDEDGGPALVSPAVLRAWEKSPAFTAAEGTRSDTVLIETDGGIAKRKIARVTPGVFDLLGGLIAREREFGTRAAIFSIHACRRFRVSFRATAISLDCQGGRQSSKSPRPAS